MTFKLYWADTCTTTGEVTINTIQDLQELYKKYGHSLIVDFMEMEIWIYNDYME